jgi:hypothetical protein
MTARPVVADAVVAQHPDYHLATPEEERAAAVRFLQARAAYYRNGTHERAPAGFAAHVAVLFDLAADAVARGDHLFHQAKP